MVRSISGRGIPVNGRSVYLEEQGRGPDWVVFEAGAGCGRTFWDPVVPLLEKDAHTVAYDRAGRARSGRISTQLSVDGMAADLVSMVEEIVPDRLILVAHSLGGLVARRAAETLGTRLRGLLLVDPLPETSPTYDTWDQTTKKVDRMLALTQQLVRIRPLARGLTHSIKDLFPPDTYQAMLDEDYTRAGTIQTRNEMRAVAAAIPEFRATPPVPPNCPTIVVSAGRPEKGRERQNSLAQEHQRLYAENLPNGRSTIADSRHFIPAEQPALIATFVKQLLSETAHDNDSLSGPNRGRPEQDPSTTPGGM
jgi:pimeloyl-ACP methyl ester carboxylesterase